MEECRWRSCTKVIIFHRAERHRREVRRVKFTNQNCTVPTIHLGPAGRRPSDDKEDDDGKHGKLLCVVWCCREEKTNNHLGDSKDFDCEGMRRMQRIEKVSPVSFSKLHIGVCA